jgi:hypothetical protein
LTELPQNDGRWPVWKLAVMMYPFSAGTVAINLYFVGLISHVSGYAAMEPVTALLWSIPLGVPAGWLFGRWARKLMDEADPPG